MNDLAEVVRQFSGKDIRVIDEDDDFWLPIIDIANAISYDNDSLTKLIRRNNAVFEGFTRTAMVTVNEKRLTVRCVNEPGLYILFGKIDITRIKSEDARTSIIQFQRWIGTTLKSIRKERAVKLTPMSTPAEIFKSEMTIATIIQEYLGLDKTLMMVTAISRTEKLTGMEMPEYKALLPAVVGPVSILTATEIGKRIDMTGAQVNIRLMELGLQEKVSKIWVLTEEGKKYGNTYYENVNHDSGSTWQGQVNKWSPHVIDLIQNN